MNKKEILNNLLSLSLTLNNIQEEQEPICERTVDAFASWDFEKHIADIIRIRVSKDWSFLKNEYDEATLLLVIAKDVWFYKNTSELPYGSYLTMEYGYHDQKAFNCEYAI
jgi:hypothetical protein